MRPMARFLPASLVLALCLAWAGLARADCPAPPDHGAELSGLIRAAQNAGSEAEGRALANRMWELWSEAPDAVAQEVLNRGMRKRSGFDLIGAAADFDRLIAYCPRYAEGWNQRAFVRFLQRDMAGSLADLDRALALNPRHVGALAGKSMVLLEMGDKPAARKALEAALQLNPWLSERHFMAMLTPEETDL